MLYSRPTASPLATKTLHTTLSCGCEATQDAMSSNTPNGKRVIVKRTSKDLEAGAEREGYLQKRSRKGKWQRRWFTLTSSGTLNYAKDLASASVDGASTALDLAGVTDVTREVGSTDIALLFG